MSWAMISETSHSYHILYKENKEDLYSKGQTIIATDPMKAYKAFFGIREHQQFIFLALYALDDVARLLNNNTSVAIDDSSIVEPPSLPIADIV
jgi:hypothetical protein